MKHILRTVIALSSALAVILFNGCSNDDSASGGGGTLAGDQVEASFVMNVPAATATRSLSVNQENAIHTLDVLAFTSQSGVLTYAYTAHATNLTPSGTKGEKTSAKIYLQKSASSAELYCFVFLANLRTELDNVSYSFTGKTRDEILEMITFDASSAWDTSTPRYLPMTGGIDTPMQISDNTNSLGSIAMVRSVAAVDVILNPVDPDSKDYTAQGFADFKLKDIKIYNTSDKGYAAPDDNNMSSNIAFQPTVSSSFGVATVAYTSSDQLQLLREAYIAESANTNRSGGSFVSNIDESDQTFVVLSAYYKGELSWYRVDFTKDDNTGERWDILRNFRYRFLITSVNGAGYATESEAAQGPASNIEVDLVVENEGDNDYIVYNGQHYLTVNEKEFTFTREQIISQEDQNRLIILTNYSGGWTIDSITNANGQSLSWLTLDGSTSGSANTDGVIYLKMSANTGSASRTAYITVKAGTLTQKVVVTQSNKSGLWLKVTDASANALTDLIFNSGQDARGTTVAARNLNVTWFPSTLTPSVKVEMVGDQLFDFGSGGTIISGNSGTLAAGGSFATNIQPNAMTSAEVDEQTGNPFLSKSSRVTFTLTDTDGSKVTKVLYVSQTNYALVLSGKKDVYMIDGNSHTITARSNTGWKMTVSANASVNSSNSIPSYSISSLVTSGFATGKTGGFNTVGDAITFTTTKLAHNGRIIVTYSDTETPAKFVPVVDTLFFSNWAGSHIYYNGSNMTFANYDDATKGAYQGLFFHWGSLWGISPMGAYSSTSTMLYLPTGGSQTGGFAFTSIPYPSSTDISSMVFSVTQSAFSADYTGSWSVSTAGGKGDICWSLTKQGKAPGASEGLKWRMPTQYELIGLTYGSGIAEPFGGTADSASTSAAGTHSLEVGYYVGHFPVAFSLGGYRYNSDNGLISQYGAASMIWTSSLGSSTSRPWAAMIPSTPASGSTRDFTEAKPVRCILMVE